MNSLSLTLAPSEPEKSRGEAYLCLQLDRATQAIFPIEQAQGVSVVPSERIAPMPNMPHCVLGLLNQRSRVFWTIDLPQLLELDPLDVHLHEYNVAIVNIENMPLGLAVQQVKGVMRITPEEIRSPLAMVASGLAPYLKGHVLKSDGILLVLDAKAILHSPSLLAEASN